MAQMLYIWPYIIFFSFPILYPYFFPPNFGRLLNRNARSGWIRCGLSRAATALPFLVLMSLVVRYNTIVHPFTLADNRHYTFYVFRILLRHPAIKYLAVPIYFVCARAVIASLGGIAGDNKTPKNRSRIKGESGIPESESKSGNRVSFVLIWLFATSLSLVTAPLVEPRYFIIPWLMWRLQVPTPRSLRDPEGFRAATEEGRMDFFWREIQDPRLWMETGWFVLVNGVIGYIFLNRGFEWSQEPGVTQRFMW